MPLTKNITSFLITLTIHFAGNGTLGQNSAGSVLLLSEKDSTKALLLNQQAHRGIENNQADSAIRYAEQSLKYALASENKGLEADNYLLVATGMIQKLEVNEGIKFYLRAADAYEKLCDHEKLLKVYNKLAENYYYLEAYEKASEYYLKAYEFLRNTKEFEKKANLLGNVGTIYFLSKQYDLSLRYFSELLQIQKEVNDTANILKALYSLSEVYKELKQFNRALTCNFDMYDVYALENDSLGMSVAMNNAGFNYVRMEDYENASKAFRKSLNIGNKAGIEDNDRAQLLLNIGICYQNMGNYEKSVFNLNEALRVQKNKDNYADVAHVENIIALTYFQQGDLYNASRYSEHSVESAKKFGDRQLLQTCYQTYSRVLKSGNDYVGAMDYYELYLGLKDSVMFEQRIYEQELTQKRIAIEKSEKELKLSLASEAMKDLALKKLRVETEKKEKELELLRKQKELNQSEKERIIQSLQLAEEQHQNELRAKEIQSLEQEKAIKDLELKRKEAEEKQQQKEIALLESQKKQQKLEMEKQDEARKKATWVILLLTVIVVLIFRGFLITRKKNTVLAEQKAEIEEKNVELEQMNEEIFAQKEYLQEANNEIQKKNDILEQKTEEIITQSERIILQKDLIEHKNKEITDSIHYAKRIQTAVLPPESFIKEGFTDYFILFKPKDIVSGDFYWAATKGDKIIITAADCTGHGVPGAFMSMLGMAFLNEIVSENITIEADNILNKLREKVIGSLRQRGMEGEAKDGIDIALCVVDKLKMEMEFAGAYNPLYFIRKGELHKIDADRMPIGIHHEVGAFSKHKISLQKGDVFYIFSDGYADQFGGSEGRKLLYTTFRSLLFSVHHLPMNEQKDRLDKAFVDWKGDLEQVDDVLVMGVKI